MINPDEGPSTFTERVAAHPRMLPQPEQPGLHVVFDELLVSERVVGGDPTDWIQRTIGRSVAVATSFRDELGRPREGEHAPDPNVVAAIEDVWIVRLSLERPKEGETTILDLTDALRTRAMDDHGWPEEEAARLIAPHHVLIPAAGPPPVASDSHGCPWGSPRPTAFVEREIPERQEPRVDVTVIDSGYFWDDVKWGANPLAENNADFVVKPSYGSIGTAGTDVVLDANGAGKLDVLAGHANFVAGIIAQHCANARITIRNHIGGFDPASDDIPTELSVALSLALSGTAQVVNLGFAFKTFGPVASRLWDAAFTLLGDKAVVVVPVGNQGSRDERYPAALRSTRANVIGVASVNRHDLTQPSAFSNRGPWVTCAAIGANVQSTFLSVNMALEDDTVDSTFDFTDNAWAMWNGTSFAAPKIAALIATEIAGGAPAVAATDAASAVLNRGTGQTDLGKVLDV